MADSTALPLQQLIASLDITCLPRILQVSSGVYYQGSVYEMSGSEMCFSTGDLIKVIGIELRSVCCEDISNNDNFELSINHTGLFKVVLEEMACLRPVGLESCLPFSYISRSEMTFDLTLREEGTLTALSSEQRKGEDSGLRSHVQGRQEEVCAPLPCPEEFSEGVGKECFTLREIMSSPRLRRRRFLSLNATKCEKSLVFTPVFQVHAIMHLRNNVVQFPSSLDMDVIDVTEVCKDVKFATPICLREVLSLPDEAFPTVVEILEGPGSHSLFKCSWVQELKPGSHLVLHRTGSSDMILLSATKNRKTQQYFLVSQQYGGRFRRLPREFNSVYELYVASIQAPGLKVCVTRNCEEVEEEGLPGLGVGEQLEVVCCQRMQRPRESDREQKPSVEALLCHRLQEPDDRDEKAEIVLPLYMQGHFLEVLPDNRKYRLTDLGKECILPIDFKVVSRDPELASDPLVGFACLRIEGATIEPTIQASFPHRPEDGFEIPTKWLSLSVSFTEDSLPWHNGQPPNCHVDRVTEVTDTFFHEFLREDNSNAAPPPPPPRPPKQNLSSVKTCKIKSRSSKKSSKTKHRPEKSLPTRELASMTLNSRRRRPAPPTPDIFDKKPPPVLTRVFSADGMTPEKAAPNTKKTSKASPQHNLAAHEDSDHDYEIVDATFVNKAQEKVMFY
ncbi:protein THEMIS2 [Brachionichthys hirsutus]|uniref:protein THEMIS2 n=1 Tax=Brachionichthys hirsutus TaxID=412623 RepID=UPI0036044F0C